MLPTLAQLNFPIDTAEVVVLPVALTLKPNDNLVIFQDGVSKRAAGSLFTVFAVDGAIAATKIYDVENFGASPSASEATNTAAFQSALDAANASGGGWVRLTRPGTYTVKPMLRVWPNTRVTMGANVTLQTIGTYLGARFQVAYDSGSGSKTRSGSAIGVTSTITLINETVTAGMVGAILLIDPFTDGNGATHQTDVHWLPGSYIIQSVNTGANTITVDRICTTGTASTLFGNIGYAMFRDGLYDTCPAASFCNSTINTYRSNGIQIEGGIIDMNNSTQPDPIGEWTYAIWIRQSSFLKVNDIRCINCRIWATYFEDCPDSVFLNISFNTRRDGIHMSGPSDRVRIENISGTCFDNAVAYVPGDSRDYPVEIFRVGFFGDISDLTVKNLNMTGSYAPVRLSGPSTRTLSNVIIDGVFGSLWSGAVGDGAYAVTVIDDGVDYSGMVFKNLLIQNIGTTCLTTTESGLVKLNASGLVDAKLRNLRVDGAWRAVLVNVGAGGAAYKALKIDGVHVLNVGTVVPLLIGSSFGLQHMELNDIAIIGNSTDKSTAGISITSGNSVAHFNVRNLFLDGYKFQFHQSGTNPTTHDFSNVYIGHCDRMFEFYGGNPTLNLSSTCLAYFNNGWNPFYYGSDANAGTMTIAGDVSYVSLNGDNAMNNASSGAVRVNSKSVRAYNQNTVPIAGDMLWDLNTSFGPSIYKNGSWSQL